MYKPVFFLVLLFLLTLGGCRQQARHLSDDLEVIAPLDSANVIRDLEPYIDSVVVVPLETCEESLVSMVTKMLLLPNGNLLIKSQTEMLLFSPEGKFLFKIGRIGRGPEEYNYVEDICLSRDGKELWILGQNEIVKYSTENGRFIGKTELELPENCRGFDALASGEDQTAFLYLCPLNNDQHFADDYFCLYRYDAQGKIIGRFLPRKDYGFSIALITQSWDNRSILRPQDNANLCYYLGDSIPVARVKIDFGAKTLKNRYSSDVQTYLRSEYYKMPIYIHDTRDYFYFTFCGPEARENYCLHNLKTHKTIVWERTGEDSNALFNLLASDGEFFYGLYSDYRTNEELDPEQQDLLKKAIIRKTNLQIGENENPLLVKVKFKNVPM